MYLLKLALRPWRLAPWSQFLSSLAVGFLLLLAGFLFWMQDGLKSIVISLKQEQAITAYLSPSVDPKEESQILGRVRELVEPYQGSVRWVNHAEFLGHLKESYPELVRDLEDLGQEMTQIVPRYISVSGAFPDATVDAIRRVPGIESAETSVDRFRPVVGAFSALRWVARLIVVGIGVALLMGLVLVARMNGYLHRDALAILKLWGAGFATLLAPSLLSGALVGLLGGLLASLGWLSVGVGLGRQIRGLSPLLHGLPPFSIEMGGLLFVLGVGLGLLAGGLGGLASSQTGSESGGTG